MTFPRKELIVDKNRAANEHLAAEREKVAKKKQLDVDFRCAGLYREVLALVPDAINNLEAHKYPDVQITRSYGNSSRSYRAWGDTERQVCWCLGNEYEIMAQVVLLPDGTLLWEKDYRTIDLLQPPFPPHALTGLQFAKLNLQTIIDYPPQPHTPPAKRRWWQRQ